MKLLKTFFLLAFLFSLHPAMAEEIVVLTTNGTQGDEPTRPMIPSRVRISAYLDGDVVVVSSTVSIMAQVTITDQMTGACVFDGLVPLAPEYRCLISGAAGAMTLTVTVGAVTYEGQFVI